MSNRYLAVVSGWLLLLAGCGGATTPTPTPGASPGTPAADTTANQDEALDLPALSPTTVPILSGDGVGEARFGGARDAVVLQTETLLGPNHGEHSNPDCDGGSLDSVVFRRDLTLFFQQGKFVGWSVDGRNNSPYRALNGIGIGSTLEQLRATGTTTVAVTSLGYEFTAGKLSGLLTADLPNGAVTNLWAGTTCIFR